MKGFSRWFADNAPRWADALRGDGDLLQWSKGPLESYVAHDPQSRSCAEVRRELGGRTFEALLTRTLPSHSVRRRMRGFGCAYDAICAAEDEIRGWRAEAAL